MSKKVNNIMSNFNKIFKSAVRVADNTLNTELWFLAIFCIASVVSIVIHETSYSSFSLLIIAYFYVSNGTDLGKIFWPKKVFYRETNDLRIFGKTIKDIVITRRMYIGVFILFWPIVWPYYRFFIHKNIPNYSCFIGYVTHHNGVENIIVALIDNKYNIIGIPKGEITPQIVGKLSEKQIGYYWDVQPDHEYQFPIWEELKTKIEI